MENRGKAFEAKVKEDFLKLPNASIDRLYDTMSGMYGVRNLCDMIGYVYPNIFYLELKSYHGNTFPLADLRQYPKLLPKIGIKGVRVGVVLWFIDHDTVLYIPISSIKKMKDDNKKSINIKMLSEGKYDMIKLPSIKKRVFMDTDYTPLLDMKEGF